MPLIARRPIVIDTGEGRQEVEQRIFSRPDGRLTVGDYENASMPNTKPMHQTVYGSDEAVIFKLTTGESYDELSQMSG